METMHSLFLFKTLDAYILPENTYFELQPHNKKKWKHVRNDQYWVDHLRDFCDFLRKQYDMPKRHDEKKSTQM